MNLNKEQFMRELFSDISREGCVELYDLLVNGYLMDTGRVLNREIGQSVIDDHLDKLDRGERGRCLRDSRMEFSL